MNEIFRRVLFVTVTTATLASTGCKESGGFAGSGGSKKSEPAKPDKTTETFTLGAAGSGKVDVAFFLDTSISMKEEITSLTSGLQGFADRLGEGSEGADYQMFIVASASKISASLRDNSKLDLINSDVNSHSGLWNAYHFLEGNTDKVPAGSLKLRSDAVKELVFLTDDNAEGITSANFGPYLKENRGKLGAVRVSGFVGLPTSVTSPVCKVAKVGQSYLELARDASIGGMIADVCNSNWAPLLNELADQVRDRSGRSNVIFLKGKPLSPSAISVLVDGAPFTSITYDAAKNKIVLDASKLGTGVHKVEVRY